MTVAINLWAAVWGFRHSGRVVGLISVHEDRDVAEYAAQAAARDFGNPAAAAWVVRLYCPDCIDAVGSEARCPTCHSVLE